MEMLVGLRISPSEKETSALFCSAFSRASLNAPSEISIPETFQLGCSIFKATGIHPDPVPISSTDSSSSD